jgi:hypothetical protein
MYIASFGMHVAGFGIYISRPAIKNGTPIAYKRY